MEATEASSSQSYNLTSVPRKAGFPRYPGPYTTVAVTPHTKGRMERCKEKNGFRSMDELINRALDQLDMKTLARDVKRLTGIARENLERDKGLMELEEASQGVAETSAWLRGKGPAPAWVKEKQRAHRKGRPRG